MILKLALVNMKRVKTILITFVALMIVVIFSNYCLKSNSDFIEVYNTLKNKLPTIKERNFLFSTEQYFKGDHKNLKDQNNLIEVDSVFYLDYLSNINEFKLWDNYQTLYFTFLVDFNDSLKHIGILQVVHNGDISNIYLVTFTDKGSVLSIFLLAKVEKSPDDLLKLRSELYNYTSIKVTKVFFVASNGDVYKDSIVSCFDKINNNFIKVKEDSLRVAIPR